MADDGIPTLDPRQQRIAKAALERIRRRRLRGYEAMMMTGFTRTCPVCGYVGEFAPVGEPPRLDGLCPSCRSRERHRLFKLWLDRRGGVGPEMAVLRFGQRDHLRYFGRDLKDHMRGAGFKVHEFVSAEPDVSTYALQRGETPYELTKPAVARKAAAAARPRAARTKSGKG